MTDALEETKRIRDSMSMYSSLHITYDSLSKKLWLSERNYPGIEVSWYRHFVVTRDEADDIIEKGYAKEWK